jgi:hypothetical protein
LKRAVGFFCQPALETQRTAGLLSAILSEENPNFTKLLYEMGQLKVASGERVARERKE